MLEFAVFDRLIATGIYPVVVIVVLDFTAKRPGGGWTVDAFNVPAGRLLVENLLYLCVMIKSHTTSVTDARCGGQLMKLFFLWYDYANELRE